MRPSERGIVEQWSVAWCQGVGRSRFRSGRGPEVELLADWVCQTYRPGGSEL